MSFFNWPPPRWMWKYTLGDLNSKVGYGIFDVAVVWSLSHVWLFCSPTDCSPPGSSVHGISQARILECALRFLLQGIFPTQGSKLCLLHWQVDSLLLSHQTASKHPFGGISVLKIPKGRGGVFSVSSPSQLRGILFTRSTSPSWGHWGKAGDRSDRHGGGCYHHPRGCWEPELLLSILQGTGQPASRGLSSPKCGECGDSTPGTCQVEGLLLWIKIIDMDMVTHLWRWRRGMFLALLSFLGCLVPYRTAVSFQPGPSLDLSALQEITCWDKCAPVTWATTSNWCFSVRVGTSGVLLEENYVLESIISKISF